MAKTKFLVTGGAGVYVFEVFIGLSNTYKSEKTQNEVISNLVI